MAEAKPAESAKVLKLTGMPNSRKVFEQGIFMRVGEINEKPYYSCAFKFLGHEKYSEYSIWWVSDPGVFILGPSETKGSGGGLMYAPGEGCADPTKVTMQWIVNDEELGDWSPAPDLRAVEADPPPPKPKPAQNGLTPPKAPVAPSRIASTAKAKAPKNQQTPSWVPTPSMTPLQQSPSFVPAPGNFPRKTNSWVPAPYSPFPSFTPSVSSKGQVISGQFPLAPRPATPLGYPGALPASSFVLPSKSHALGSRPPVVAGAAMGFHQPQGMVRPAFMTGTTRIF